MITRFAHCIVAVAGFVGIVYGSGTPFSECQVSDWTKWGDCIGDCSFSMRVRNRIVVKPPFPEPGIAKVLQMKSCPPLYQIQQCTTNECLTTTDSTPESIDNADEQDDRFAKEQEARSRPVDGHSDEPAKDILELTNQEENDQNSDLKLSNLGRDAVARSTQKSSNQVKDASLVQKSIPIDNSVGTLTVHRQTMRMNASRSLAAKSSYRPLSVLANEMQVQKIFKHLMELADRNKAGTTQAVETLEYEDLIEYEDNDEGTSPPAAKGKGTTTSLEPSTPTVPSTVTTPSTPPTTPSTPVTPFKFSKLPILGVKHWITYKARESDSETTPATPGDISEDVATPRNSSRGSPREIPRKILEDILTENPEDIPKENPNGGPKENPNENPKETAKESPKENPKESPKENLKESTKENPKESPKENLKESTKENPKESPKENLKGNPNESPKETPNESPKESAKERPKDSPKSSSKDTIKDIATDTSKDIAKDIPEGSPRDTPKDSPTSPTPSPPDNPPATRRHGKRKRRTTTTSTSTTSTTPSTTTTDTRPPPAIPSNSNLTFINDTVYYEYVDYEIEGLEDDNTSTSRPDEKRVQGSKKSNGIIAPQPSRTITPTVLSLTSSGTPGPIISTHFAFVIDPIGTDVTVPLPTQAIQVSTQVVQVSTQTIPVSSQPVQGSTRSAQPVGQSLSLSTRPVNQATTAVSIAKVETIAPLSTTIIETRTAHLPVQDMVTPPIFLVSIPGNGSPSPNESDPDGSPGAGGIPDGDDSPVTDGSPSSVNNTISGSDPNSGNGLISDNDPNSGNSPNNGNSPTDGPINGPINSNTSVEGAVSIPGDSPLNGNVTINGNSLVSNTSATDSGPASDQGLTSSRSSSSSNGSSSSSSSDSNSSRSSNAPASGDSATRHASSSNIDNPSNGDSFTLPPSSENSVDALSSSTSVPTSASPSQPDTPALLTPSPLPERAAVTGEPGSRYRPSLEERLQYAKRGPNNRPGSAVSSGGFLVSPEANSPPSPSSILLPPPAPSLLPPLPAASNGPAAVLSSLSTLRAAAEKILASLPAPGSVSDNVSLGDPSSVPAPLSEPVPPPRSGSAPDNEDSILANNALIPPRGPTDNEPLPALRPDVPEVAKGATVAVPIQPRLPTNKSRTAIKPQSEITPRSANTSQPANKSRITSTSQPAFPPRTASTSQPALPPGPATTPGIATGEPGGEWYRRDLLRSKVQREGFLRERGSQGHTSEESMPSLNRFPFARRHDGPIDQPIIIFTTERPPATGEPVGRFRQRFNISIASNGPGFHSKFQVLPVIKTENSELVKRVTQLPSPTTPSMEALLDTVHKPCGDTFGNRRCCKLPPRSRCPDGRLSQLAFRWFRLAGSDHCVPYNYGYCGSAMEQLEKPIKFQEECYEMCYTDEEKRTLPVFRELRFKVAVPFAGPPT